MSYPFHVSFGDLVRNFKRWVRFTSVTLLLLLKRLTLFTFVYLFVPFFFCDVLQKYFRLMWQQRLCLIKCNRNVVVVVVVVHHFLLITNLFQTLESQKPGYCPWSVLCQSKKMYSFFIFYLLVKKGGDTLINMNNWLSSNKENWNSQNKLSKGLSKYSNHQELLGIKLTLSS